MRSKAAGRASSAGIRLRADVTTSRQHGLGVEAKRAVWVALHHDVRARARAHRVLDRIRERSARLRTGEETTALGFGGIKRRPRRARDVSRRYAHGRLGRLRRNFGN